MNKIASSIISAVASVVFPNYCPHCGTGWKGGYGFICPDCWSKLSRAAVRFNRLDPVFNKRLSIAFAYNEIIKLLVHHMKFYGRKDIAEVFGRQLYKIFFKLLKDLEPAGVIPVPLHPVRIRERGYDQTLIMSGELCHCLNVKLCDNLIRRTKNTRPQSRLSDVERKVNAIDAFAPKDSANPESDGTFILVDDVFHTGSTLKSCIKALNQREIFNIFVLTASG